MAQRTDEVGFWRWLGRGAWGAAKLKWLAEDPIWEELSALPVLAVGGILIGVHGVYWALALLLPTVLLLLLHAEYREGKWHRGQR